MTTTSSRWKTRAKSLIYPWLKKRRLHGYCVSMPKSGTTSLAGIFNSYYRARHERERALVIRTILDASRGVISPKEKRRILRERDFRLWLEFDSSTLNYFILEDLLEEFPRAQFVLTIRDPYSWLDATINHLLTRGLDEEWGEFVDWWFEPDRFSYSPGEEVLEREGLYPLDCFFASWANHNLKILETVPKDRLLIVRTDEIDDSLPRLAEFFSIPESTLDASRSHLHKTANSLDILAKLDRGLVNDKCRTHCGPLLERFFEGAES